jgi:DNA polymerase-3 subunit epsilon
MKSYSFSVVDVETTGFSPKKYDKIIEIGITKIDQNGNVIDTFESLINPNRDVGATHIHGITSEMVLNAPIFSNIAGNILNILNESLLVAHNAPFDIKFLMSEFENSGFEIENYPYICTLSMSRKLFPELPSKKLISICEYFGIEISNYHSALADSFATAQLLSILLKEYLDLSSLDINKRFKINKHMDFMDATNILTRKDVLKEDNKNTITIKNVLDRIPTIESEDEKEIAYAEKLDEILLDRIITEKEASDLVDIAIEAGIKKEQAINIHKNYLKNVIRISLIDGQISDSEMNDILKIQKLLHLNDINIKNEILKIQKEVSNQQIIDKNKISGKTVCFTGELKSKIKGNIISRKEAHTIALENGMVIKNNVTMDLNYLVVSDPNTQSSKAKKARKYGTSIIDENAFWNMLGIQVE